jgi:hypothetical protein
VTADLSMLPPWWRLLRLRRRWLRARTPRRLMTLREGERGRPSAQLPTFHTVGHRLTSGRDRIRHEVPYPIINGPNLPGRSVTRGPFPAVVTDSGRSHVDRVAFLTSAADAPLSLRRSRVVPFVSDTNKEVQRRWIRRQLENFQRPECGRDVGS